MFVVEKAYSKQVKNTKHNSIVRGIRSVRTTAPWLFYGQYFSCMVIEKNLDHRGERVFSHKVFHIFHQCMVSIDSEYFLGEKTTDQLDRVLLTLN